MSIEEAECIVIRTASLSVELISNLVNEGVIRNVLYNIKAMAIIVEKIKMFLNGYSSDCGQSFLVDSGRLFRANPDT